MEVVMQQAICFDGIESGATEECIRVKIRMQGKRNRKAQVLRKKHRRWIYLRPGSGISLPRTY